MYPTVTLPRMILNTHAVYARTIGSMITTTQNMSSRVRWLDTASHTVRLEAACVDDGMMNGNIAKPAVKITPAFANALRTKDSRGGPLRASAATPSAPPNASPGASHIHGMRAKLPSQRPGAESTVLASGVKAVPAGGMESTRYPAMPYAVQIPAITSA